MPQTGIAVKLRVNPQAGQRLQTGLHDPPGGDAVGISHAGVGGGIVRGVLAQAGVLHDHRAGAGQIIAAEGCGAVGSQPGRHPCARRAAPQGVAGGVHLQLAGVVKDKGNGPGQILAGGLRPGTVDEGKGVVAHAGQLQGVRKAVVHGAHIGESASRVAHGEPRPRLPPEKEEPRILLGRIGGLLLVGINIIEDGLTGQSPLLQRVDNLHRLIGVDVAVVGQVQRPQGAAAVIAVVDGKKQPAVIPKGGIVPHRFDGRVHSKFSVQGQLPLLHSPLLRRPGAAGEKNGEQKRADSGPSSHVLSSRPILRRAPREGPPGAEHGARRSCLMSSIIKTPDREEK